MKKPKQNWIGRTPSINAPLKDKEEYLAERGPWLNPHERAAWRSNIEKEKRSARVQTYPANQTREQYMKRKKELLSTPGRGRTNNKIDWNNPNLIIIDCEWSSKR